MSPIDVYILARRGGKTAETCGDSNFRLNNIFSFVSGWDGRLRNLKRIAVPSQNLPTRPLDKKLSPAQLKRKEDRAARAAKRLERVVPRYVSKYVLYLIRFFWTI